MVFTAHNQRDSGHHEREIWEFCHGQVNKIGAHSDMRIRIPELQRALKFRIGSLSVKKFRILVTQRL